MEITLSTVGVSFVIGLISHLATGRWEQYKGKAAADLKDLSRKVETAIEEKTGVGLSKEGHARVDAAIDKGVAFADGFMSSGPFVRNVLRTLVDRNPERLYIYAEQFRKIDWKKYLMDQFSPEVKAVVNAEKKAIACNIVRSELVKHEEIDQVVNGNTEAIETAVSAAATADKNQKVILHSGEPITPELLETILAETKARVENLKQK